MNNLAVAAFILIVAVLAFMFLPSPLNWVVGLVLLGLAVVVALGGTRGRSPRP